MNARIILLTTIVFICCWIASNTSSMLHAQISVVINSLDDDADAYAWDDPNTTDIDESRDGTVLDGAGRITLRAAIEEAWNMNDGVGVPIDITLNISGTLALGGWGDLTLPDNSHLHGNNLTTIQGSLDNTNFSDVLGLGNSSIIEGVNFKDGYVLIGVSGDDNIIAGNVLQGAALNGISVGGNRNIIGRGNIIFGGGTSEILLAGNDNIVKGNYVGLDATGNVAASPAEFGFQIVGDNNTIGGTDPDDRNIISGNSVSGIMISGVTGKGVGTTIIGNYIGTDPAGTQKRPNNYGIQVLSGGPTIGGTTDPERNVISGNKYSGIETRGDALAINIIGNSIGVDPSGASLGNTDGINLSPGSFDCVIDHNTISCNDQAGIEIFGQGVNPSWNHRIRGNKISHNGYQGILIGGVATDNVIGSSLTQDFAPNVIDSKGNGGVELGVFLVGPARANTIRKNILGQNATQGIFSTKGIAIYPDFQDKISPPSIANYTYIGSGAATVTATHHRRGSLIDVYSAEPNQAGRYEGIQWVGSGTITDSLVPTTITISSCNCSYLVATATDPQENTSMFSDSLETTGATDAGKERTASPMAYSLWDAYPNPFNPSTTISYELPKATQVTLKIYDVFGREVTTLVDGMQYAGFKSVEWNAANVASGVYFYKLQAGNFSATKKLSVIK